MGDDSDRRYRMVGRASAFGPRAAGRDQQRPGRLGRPDRRRCKREFCPSGMAMAAEGF
jgi:hypothetical protein